MDNKVIKHSVALDSREAYEFYRLNRKKVSKAVNQFNYFVKAVNGLLTTIKESMAEEEDGVHIEGLGYFCNLAFPTVINRRHKSIFLKSKKSVNYMPHLFLEEFYQGWSMVGTAPVRFENDIRITKKEYKVNFSFIDNFKEAKIANNRHNKRRTELKYFK